MQRAGGEMGRRFREHIPVILLSALASDDASAEGLDAGADDYLAKPFSRHELLARVQNRLSLARLNTAERLARCRAETAIRAHRALYSVLAHDLRSPLQTGYMCVTRLKQQEITPAQRKTVTTLERCLDSLREQLEAILGQMEAISGDDPGGTSTL